MSKFTSFIILFLLPVIPAAGQVLKYYEYEEISDSTSIHYTKPGIPRFGWPLTGGFESHRVRITTDNKDTFVCRVRVSISPMTSNVKEAKNALGRAELLCEDLHPWGYEITGGEKDYCRTETFFYKIRKHMRLKLNAYFPDHIGKRMKRITAYIDYFPFSNRTSEARYKAKRMKQRYGEKYRVEPQKMWKKTRKRREREEIEMEKWYAEESEKEETWLKKYYKKYYPEYYRKLYQEQ